MPTGDGPDVAPRFRDNQARNWRETRNMRRLYTFLLAPDSNCVDVGCHGGYELREMLRIAPRGHHIAYEPLPHLAHRLRLMHPDVDVRQVALADRRGETDFQFVRTAPAYSGLQRGWYPAAVDEATDIETIVVAVEDLDSSLPPGYVPHLVKIDVQGAEGLVLRGAIETLRVHRPWVVFEHERAATPPAR